MRIQHRTFYSFIPPILVIVLSISLASSAFAQEKPRKGKYTEKHSNGTVKVKGRYKSGLKQGEWLWYHPNGKPEKQEFYVNDTLHGPSVHYNADGTLVWKATYKKGKPDGPFYSVNKGGWYTEGFYRDGIEDSTWKEYSVNGKLLLQWQMENGKKHGPYLMYALNGNKIMEMNYENGVLQGPYKRWSGEMLKEGMLLEEGFYLDGVKHGKIIEYTDGVNNRIETQYEKGLRHGVASMYINGELRAKTLYEENVQKHESVYYEGGKIRRETNYVKGVPDGEEVEYFENGNVKRKTRFSSGMLDGKEITYYYPGDKIQSEVHYRNGKRHGISMEWYENGKKRKELNYDNGNRDGKQTVFFESGKIEEELHYTKGIRTGTWITYHANGIKKYERTYKNDKLVEVIAYDEKGKKVRYEETTVFSESEQDNPYLDEPGGAPSDPGEIFIVVEEMPEFIGNLSSYLAKNIVYPADAREMGIQGTVYVRFVILKDGTVKDAQIVKGIPGGKSLEEEALRVVNGLPPFKPGKQNGKAVDVQYTLPVKFMIE